MLFLCMSWKQPERQRCNYTEVFEKSCQNILGRQLTCFAQMIACFAMIFLYTSLEGFEKDLIRCGEDQLKGRSQAYHFVHFLLDCPNQFFFLKTLTMNHLTLDFISGVLVRRM